MSPLRGEHNFFTYCSLFHISPLKHFVNSFLFPPIWERVWGKNPCGKKGEKLAKSLNEGKVEGGKAFKKTFLVWMVN